MKPTYYEMKNGIDPNKPNQNPISGNSKKATHRRHKDQKSQVVDKILSNLKDNPEGYGLVLCQGLRAKEEIQDLLNDVLTPAQMGRIEFSTGLTILETPEQETYDWATIYHPDFLDLYYHAHVRLKTGGN